MNFKLELFKFLNVFKFRRINQLNYNHRKRLNLIINLMTKYLLQQIFWLLVFISFMTLNYSLYIAYTEPNSGYNLWIIIFWSPILLNFFIQLYGIVSVGFILWVLTTFYLRYKFIEINQKFETIIKINDNSLLINTIKKHHSLALQTRKLNNFFSYMIFFLYVISTPALMISIQLIISDKTVLYMRIVFIILNICVTSSVFLVNLFSSLISQWARKPLPLFYSYLFKNKLSIKDRLKIRGFIEVLSGPDIGFYCWFLFPMNNFRFFLFVADCVYVYFIVLEFIDRFDL